MGPSLFSWNDILHCSVTEIWHTTFYKNRLELTIYYVIFLNYIGLAKSKKFDPNDETGLTKEQTFYFLDTACSLRKNINLKTANGAIWRKSLAQSESLKFFFIDIGSIFEDPSSARLSTDARNVGAAWLRYTWRGVHCSAGFATQGIHRWTSKLPKWGSGSRIADVFRTT